MDPVIHSTLRLALAVLFGAAALHKLAAFRAFVSTLADHRIVPAALVPAAAVLVVVAEVAAAATRAPMLAGGLLLAYAGVIALNLARGRDHVDCGCVGIAGRERLSWWLVGRNLACAAAAFVLAIDPTARATGWIDGVTIGAATAALAALYVAADGLIANAAAHRRLREAT